MTITTKFNIGDQVKGVRGTGKTFTFTVGEIMILTLPNRPGSLYIRYRSVHRNHKKPEYAHLVSSTGQWVVEKDCFPAPAAPDRGMVK